MNYNSIFKMLYLIMIVTILFCCSIIYKLQKEKNKKVILSDVNTNVWNYVYPITDKDKLITIGYDDNNGTKYECAVCISHYNNSILIGKGAVATNEYELVIRFKDGSEFRRQLPTNSVVDF